MDTENLGQEDRSFLDTLITGNVFQREKVMFNDSSFDDHSDFYDHPSAMQGGRRKTIWERGAKMLQNTIGSVRRTYDELKYARAKDFPESSEVLQVTS